MWISWQSLRDGMAGKGRAAPEDLVVVLDGDPFANQIEPVHTDFSGRRQRRRRHHSTWHRGGGVWWRCVVWWWGGHALCGLLPLADWGRGRGRCRHASGGAKRERFGQPVRVGLAQLLLELHHRRGPTSCEQSGNGECAAGWEPLARMMGDWVGGWGTWVCSVSSLVMCWVMCRWACSASWTFSVAISCTCASGQRLFQHPTTLHAVAGVRQ